MTWLLHSAWRATAPYRVRIGLNLKGVAYDFARYPVITEVAARAAQHPAFQAAHPDHHPDAKLPDA
jgi:maleylacetoacetate isomerase/maleylpyruvate isomerase